MTKLIHSQAKDCYPLIALINQEAIARLNKIFDTHYTKGAVMEVTVSTVKKDKEDNTKFFDRLMRKNQTL
jgi:hypothetical protein